MLWPEISGTGWPMTRLIKKGWMLPISQSSNLAISQSPNLAILLINRMNFTSNSWGNYYFQLILLLKCSCQTSIVTLPTSKYVPTLTCISEILFFPTKSHQMPGTPFHTYRSLIWIGGAGMKNMINFQLWENCLASRQLLRKGFHQRSLILWG